MTTSFIDKKFIQVSTITIVLLYLVILAGSIVRATDSGMGCPDWPKCFGYYIPPTDPTQVEFHSHHAYKKNTLIIKSDTLWRAKLNFTSGPAFDYNNWEKYPAHDYAQFFVYKTWIEYINRLVGAVNALALSVLFFLSLLRIKKDPISFFVITGAMFVMAFVIWLGAVVVNTNLAPQKISFHMISSMILLAAVIFSNNRAKRVAGFINKEAVNKGLNYLLWIAVSLTIIQVLFGTQVRQQIDNFHHSILETPRKTWISQLNELYSIHQVTAMLVVLLNALLYVQLKKYNLSMGTAKRVRALLMIVLLEYVTGFILNSFSIPSLVQPIHLFFALGIFGLQIALCCRIRSIRKDVLI